MGYSNQQIGWSQEAKLLQEIEKKLVKLTQVLGQSQTTTTTTTTP